MRAKNWNRSRVSRKVSISPLKWKRDHFQEIYGHKIVPFIYNSSRLINNNEFYAIIVCIDKSRNPLKSRLYILISIVRNSIEWPVYKSQSSEVEVIHSHAFTTIRIGKLNYHPSQSSEVEVIHSHT